MDYQRSGLSLHSFTCKTVSDIHYKVRTFTVNGWLWSISLAYRFRTSCPVWKFVSAFLSRLKRSPFLPIHLYWLLITHQCLLIFQSLRKEFDGFERLFSRFLSETGPSIEWERIKLLPEGAVSVLWIYIFLILCKVNHYVVLHVLTH